MTPYSFVQKIAAEAGIQPMPKVIPDMPKAPKATASASPTFTAMKQQKPQGVTGPTPHPLAKPQQFPAVPASKPDQYGLTPTPPVYKHPSGALQLGKLNYIDESQPTKQTLIGSRPVANAAASRTIYGSIPVSPGRDSGSSVLRISHHGGGQGQYDYAAPVQTGAAQYALTNPGLNADGSVNGSVSGVAVGQRANLLNPNGPEITPPTKQNFPDDEAQYVQSRLWNKRRQAAFDATLEGPALTADTNPSTIIAQACNGDPAGCSPATYAKWINAERGLHNGYAKQLSNLPSAEDALSTAVVSRQQPPTLFDRLKTTLGFSGKQPQQPVQDQLVAPKPPEMAPLNLNKVVMVPPGRLGVGTGRIGGDKEVLTGLPLPLPDTGSFGRPYTASNHQYTGGQGSPAHEYRLTRGGNPMQEQHWTDTGTYTDARENLLPLHGIGDEAKEFGRHIGLGKELGGGDTNSYLDKIRDINNNPDATYAQKVRSNFARPVGTAMQFGREAGGMLRENLEQAARANSAPGLGGAGFEGFSPY
jgi:hypothetical protein